MKQDDGLFELLEGCLPVKNQTLSCLILKIDLLKLCV